MSNGFPFIDIIFFAAVALFIAFRLRNVLGRRTGHERRPEAPTVTPSTRDNVVSLPNREEQAEAAFSHIDDAELRQGLTAIRRVDPDFDLEGFLMGARQAFEMIVDAFARGDTDQLRPLLADEVYAGFAEAIEQRRAAGETLETEVVAIKEADVVEAHLDGSRALVTVRFVSDQVNVTRDAEGEVVDGDPEQLAEIVDLWTFGRDTDSRDPNWELASTGVDED
jgi:predicted lipid-binding transport protein (Tim44 family)